MLTIGETGLGAYLNSGLSVHLFSKLKNIQKFKVYENFEMEMSI